MGLLLEVESRPKSDPRHAVIFCEDDHECRYLPVCLKRCVQGGRCLAFWRKLDELGIDSKDIMNGDLPVKMQKKGNIYGT